jgi:hypothetical protein
MGDPNMGTFAFRFYLEGVSFNLGTAVSFTASYGGNTVNLINGLTLGRNYFEFYSYRKDIA